MPSKELKCEFCDKCFRKNELARHIKAKHITELAQYVLQEYIDNPQHNLLERYAKLINPKCNPIYSKIYEGGCYYFGANPSFFEEDDSTSAYIKSDENMKIHNEFLAEVVKSISLYDFLQTTRTIQINSEEVRQIKNEKYALIEKNKELEELVKSLKATVEYQAQDIKDYREATECSTTIKDMKQEIESLTNTSNYYQKEADYLQSKVKQLQEALRQNTDDLMEDMHAPGAYRAHLASVMLAKARSQLSTGV